MLLSFNELDLKTDETLDLPPRTIEHTYLAAKLELTGRFDDPNFRLYTGKLYDGVTETDLIRVREQQGLHLLFSNSRTAYFGDAETCQMVDEQVLQNFSDAAAYGSVPVSDAKASVLRANRRILVIDDEADPNNPAAVWGEAPLLLPNGTQFTPDGTTTSYLVEQATSKLGDSYGLIAPELHRELARQETLEGIQGRLPVAQTHTLVGSDLDTEAIKTQLKALLYEELWEVEAFQKQLLPNTDYETPVTLETKVRSDGSMIVQWHYTTESNPDAVLQGKALVAAGADGNYQVTLLGGTLAQQTVSNQEFNQLVQAQDTPFQFRAGIPEWQGVIKGTCRTSELCRELGVDAIIPKSAIKGDGKTTPVGMHTVDHLFWSRKSEAKVRQQKLGAQVLVNLPAGTRTDIEPKVQAALAKLQAAVSDPRVVADLYCQKHERRQELLEAQSFDRDETETAPREDWVYTVLKADARPTTIVEGIESGELATTLKPESWQQLQAIAAQGLAVEAFVEQANEVLSTEEVVLSAEVPFKDKTGIYRRFTVDDILNPVETTATYPTTFSTLQRGGYGQMLEHEKVVDALNRFLKDEWKELALGGITVPSALAQPHSLLQPDEVCFTGLPHGAKVAIYRSPVANVSAFTVLTNNLDVIREQDQEAFRQQGVTYLNPDTAKQQLIDFDGDTAALIPELALSKVKAQTLDSLPPNEVYVPGLANGQAITLYHSRNQVSEFVNNTALADLPEPNTERRKLNQVYVHPDAGIDPEQPVQLGYYDGLHGFKGLHEEITQLNLPENRPVQTEKEKKIPRNAYDPSLAKLSPEDQALAARFTTKEAAALDAADNPTGLIANVGMRLEALRTELQALPDDLEQKEAYLSNARKGFTKLSKQVSDPESRKPVVPPQPTADGYDFIVELSSIANGAKLITAQDPAKRLEQVNTQLAQMERFLFQTEGLNAINLQRGVDTPKSARIVSQDWYEFCKSTVYKKVEWVDHRKEEHIYLTQKLRFGEDTIAQPTPLPNNTRDAVGRLVDLTNEAFVADPLDYQELKAYDGFLLSDANSSGADLAIITAQIQAYNSAHARAGAVEQKAEIEEGPALQLQTRDGVIEVTNLIRFDPEGKSPLWDAVRAGVPVEFAIVENKNIKQGKAWETQETKKKPGTHDYAVMAWAHGESLGAIGTLCNLSTDKLAEAELKRTNPSLLYKLQKEHVKAPGKLKHEIFQALWHETGGLTERPPELAQGKLAHAGDKAEAKVIREAANAARQEWAATIPPEDREYWARLAWSNCGQPFALNVFPDVVSQQAETFQFTEATLIGLQYEDWESVDWTQPNTLRLAIGTEAVNPEPTPGKAQEPHYDKMILQAQTADGWKLVGTLSSSMGKGNQKDWQCPVGLIAEGTLMPHMDNRIVTTSSGLMLTVKAFKPDALQPTEGEERYSIKLVSETKGKNKTGYIVDLENKKLGRLDETAYAAVQESEAVHGKIFNSNRRSSISVAPDPNQVATTGTVRLNPETVQIPEVWSKHNVNSWLQTLAQTAAEPGQVTSEPGVNKGTPTKGAATLAIATRDITTAVTESTGTAVAAVLTETPVTRATAVPETPPPGGTETEPGKALPLPVKLREPEPGETLGSTKATVGTSTQTVTLLEQQYREERQRMTTMFEEKVGIQPTPEQVDQAIAMSIYRETPDLAVATQKLQVLTKSPITQGLYNKAGFEAALTYVNQVTVTAYQRVQAAKHKAAERNGNDNGRH